MKVNEKIIFTIDKKRNVSLKELKDKVSIEININILINRMVNLFFGSMFICGAINSFLVATKHSDTAKGIASNPVVYEMTSSVGFLISFLLLSTGFKFLFSNNACLFKSKRKIIKNNNNLLTKRFLEDNEINEEIAQCLVNDLERSNKND